MSLLGTGISPIRVVLAGAVLLTAAAGGLRARFTDGRTPERGRSSCNLSGLLPDSSAVSRSNLGHLPLVFEANQGQTDSRVKFLARGSGYGLFLTS